MCGIFKGGARDNCLIRHTQYQPLTLWLSVKNTSIPSTAHSLGNPAL